MSMACLLRSYWGGVPEPNQRFFLGFPAVLPVPFHKQYRSCGRSRMSDPFSVAVEHIAYCIRQGMDPVDFFVSVRQPLPSRNPTWGEAIWTAARLHQDMLERNPRLADAVVYSPVYAQFRLPLKRVA